MQNKQKTFLKKVSERFMIFILKIEKAKFG